MMTYNVYRLHNDGRAELLFREVSGDVAESVTRHPSMRTTDRKGNDVLRPDVVVIPSFADAPTLVAFDRRA